MEGKDERVTFKQVKEEWKQTSEWKDAFWNFVGENPKLTPKETKKEEEVEEKNSNEKRVRKRFPPRNPKLKKDESETQTEEVQDGTIDMDVSWKEVQWDRARENAAELLQCKVKEVAPDVREKYENEAPSYWDKFYKSNKDKFFKDRHYLQYQFEDLQQTDEGNSKLDGKKLIEVGCGGGNTLFPLLQEHKGAFFFAFDFSEQAVNIVKQNALYDESRCKAFVCDIASEDIPEFIEAESLDYALMIFVLSAVAPEKMKSVLQRLHKVLKPGGAILFRDYGVYDMTHVRFLTKENRKLSNNYYVRADGTRCYYFTTDELTKMFSECGFETDDLRYDTRELRNRKRLINMYRVWVNGKFVKR